MAIANRVNKREIQSVAIHATAEAAGDEFLGMKRKNVDCASELTSSIKKNKNNDHVNDEETGCGSTKNNNGIEMVNNNEQFIKESNNIGAEQEELEKTFDSPPIKSISTFPLPSLPCLPASSFGSCYESDESDTGIVSNCPVIINDVMGLRLGPLPRKESRWFVNDVDVSEKWHLFKEKSLELAKREGLFVESHTQQILSLSHIFLLKPKQHCPLMVEVFGAELLEMMHKDVMQRLTKQETEFDVEILIKLIRIVKRLQREEITREIAVSELQILAVSRAYGECAILKAIRNIIERVPRTTLKSSIGEVELCTTYIDSVLSPLFMDPDRNIFLRWSNKEATESKARKSTGRAKQPDAVINDIDQLSWSLSRGHGEAKVQEELNNLYLLCTDLIRVAIFNKDAIDFYNMNCILGFQVVGQHITFYLTTLLYDALYIMVEVGHIDVPMSFEQVPAFLTSLDTLLIIYNAFWANCIISTEKKESSRRSTLETPNFKEMVIKTRDRRRYCQLRF